MFRNDNMDISPKTQILPPRRSNRIDLDTSTYIETPNPFGVTSFDADSSETFSGVPDELYNLFDSTTPDISGDKISPDSKQESKDDFNPFSTASNKKITHGDLSKANSFMVNDGSLFHKKLKPPGSAFGGKRINRFELEFKNPAKSKTLGKTDSRLLETSDIDKSEVEKKSEIYSPSSKVFDVSPQDDTFGNDSFEANFNSQLGKSEQNFNGNNIVDQQSNYTTPSKEIIKTDTEDEDSPVLPLKLKDAGKSQASIVSARKNLFPETSEAAIKSIDFKDVKKFEKPKPSFSGFTIAGTNTQVQVDPIALDAVKNQFNNQRVNTKSFDNSKPSGFTTGLGCQVKISKEAIESIRKNKLSSTSIIPATKNAHISELTNQSAKRPLDGLHSIRPDVKKMRLEDIDSEKSLCRSLISPETYFDPPWETEGMSFEDKFARIGMFQNTKEFCREFGINADTLRNPDFDRMCGLLKTSCSGRTEIATYFKPVVEDSFPKE